MVIYSEVGHKRETDGPSWYRVESKGLYTYYKLDEPLLTSELARLSYATKHGEGDIRVDSVTFQPCPDPEARSQDRLCVEHWEFGDGTWTFAGVFDGHGGHEAADYTVERLPGMIKTKLEACIGDNAVSEPENVSNLLKEAIAELDKSIEDGIVGLFPGGVDSLSKMSAEDVQAIINDHDSGGNNSHKVLLGMRGTTALVSLIDPKRESLWVASLGDCVAAFGTRYVGGDPQGAWTTNILSVEHNGQITFEQERIRAAHPGEKEAVLYDRVLGAIAVTRAIGDHSFKLPATYITDVFLRSVPGYRVHSRVEDFARRNLTPPYMSAEADVRHVALDSSKEKFLLLCSDGLTDIDRSSENWTRAISKGITHGDKDKDKDDDNLALAVLRGVLGGEDEEMVSKHITVEIDGQWMDDTTIVVLSW